MISVYVYLFYRKVVESDTKKPRIDEIKDLLNRYSYEYYTLDKPECERCVLVIV